jgi:signal transduction histidine kinase/ActR/RegA family two-component response regulator
VTDITKRKRIEDSLRESEEWRWIALDAAQLGAWDYRCDTGVVVRDERSREQVGAADGASTAQAEGERIHPDDRPLVANAYARAIEKDADGTLDVEFRVVLPDGTERWIASHGRAFFEGEGETRHAVRLAGANMDITDRKRIEAEATTLYARAEQARREAEEALGALREADRRKDEFLAMLAHELRNPLAPIRNAVEVMRLVGAPSPREQRAREIVDRQLTHLTRLVDDLLEVSRITRGKIALARAPLILSDVVEEAIETARPLVEQHEHTLSVVHAPDAVRLEGDRARLVQVIANLLTNAAKFTPRGGHITLTTARSAAGEALVKVRDTGIGIPVEMQGRVFELFAQEESTLARSQGGLGIGLTLVKRLVELHGGSVALESEGRDRGAQFTITLPALAAAPHATGESAPPAGRPHGGALRVLVVEDNPDAAESFQMLLALGGHVIRVAHHGIQALRLLEEFTPDVAFIDIGLPGMTGFELAQRLRADHRTKGALLVAVTGYGRESDKEQALQSGFDRHLTKPVDHEVVLALLTGFRSSLEPGERASTLLH